MNIDQGIPEGAKASRFLENAQDEAPLWDLLTGAEGSLLIIGEGFEERSLGVIEGMAERGFRAKRVVVAQYPPDPDGLNELYRERFAVAARHVSREEPIDRPIPTLGEWLPELLHRPTYSSIFLDITALSNRLIFPTLDRLVEVGFPVLIAYTEAGEYWPTEKAWNSLQLSLGPEADIGDEVDRMPWLFGQDHEIAFVDGHEGFETAAGGRALIGFLPFKCARLAAITGEFGFSSSVFVAGRPRLIRNNWRLGAVKTINSRIAGRWRTVDMDTFAYKRAFRDLLGLLSDEDCSLLQHNVHIAILGSKLQNVACWALSRLLPEITLVSSAPRKYHRESFSDGIGVSWGFPLTDPVSSLDRSEGGTLPASHALSVSHQGSSEAT
jgi:hypothetical protein